MTDIRALQETLEQLEALDYRLTFQKFYDFKPYARQKEFLDAGRTKRERLLIAGNQNGKCVSYRTLIDHPDGTATPAGKLFERGERFQVLSWDGECLVRALATVAICKPAEPIVRLLMASGEWFECSLNHRVLTYEGWRFVGSLLPSVPYLSETSPDIAQSVRGAGARHWFGKPSDWLDRCFAGRRRYGGPLPETEAAGQVYSPSQFDAPTHSHSASRPSNTLSAEFGHPSNLDDPLRFWGRSWLFLARDVCRCALRTIAKRQAVRPLGGVASLVLRSALARLWGRVGPVALVSPKSMAGNKIVSYTLIASEPIYDFTVPVFHNYVAAGVVHHNTHIGAYEAACHMTGLYPPDWSGRRFDKPTKGWIAGETSLVVRDVQQKKLCGEPGVDELFGTGMIPKELFVDRPSLARGVTDAYDTIQVRHVSGGVSVGRFKSYEQGRQKFQGESIDWGWCDEEPPSDVYAEFLTRTVATGGMAFMTFTPLKGRSSVVLRFLDEPSPDRSVTTMTIEDALHIPAAERARIIAAYLPHEREARARGVPMLGSGRIFMAPEETVVEAPLEYIPQMWAKLWAVDFGIDHPFAAALILWDRDADVIHVHHTIRISDSLPLQHAAAMKPIGVNVPVAWPNDGNIRRDDGKPMSDHYKRCGLLMLPSHATWPDGSVSTEAGIMEMDERERTGRLKYAAHMSDLLEERRFYHRKDGQIVKLKDDILSAVRVAVMQKRSARTVQLGGRLNTLTGGGLVLVAEGTDFPLFGT